MNYKRCWIWLLSLVFLVFAVGFRGQRDVVVYIERDDFKSFSRIANSSIMNYSKRAAWNKVVPQVEEITIQSTADGSDQPALFYNSGSTEKKPLLLVLHSWSADYLQHFSIPYGVWAVENDWVFIHPDYRGPYVNPQATASELAIQDILDALEYAKQNANIDESRVYITGFSGGAMTTLIMVGRYPSLWTAAAAWVPVYDLPQWYETTRNATHNYASKIENSCGGPPLRGTEAYRECKRRSASTYLSNARGEPLKVYIATGIGDVFVPPGHSLQAFNDLARPQDRFGSKEIEYVNEHLQLPQHLRKDLFSEIFDDAGYTLLYQRSSSNVVLQIYDGNHDVIYNAGLSWLSRQRRKY
ncbi:prolyl oligopeptidase family serine peptidase [Chitinispirillales bacterium ANBcel5]|uniref:alpha/beta hydrolase family protein n=1 Tax=Cellulosispirillum alkaliphilum TaxID=3039283 RepID=UPI002A57E6B8|nr:prolyl oligopeptidase family serine peptidase [Chitinispirillales bacterium ANBcel5]